MSKPTILITGATGKSGFVAVKYLLKKGFKVKAMARGKSQKTDELENLGAEVVFGNLLDITSVEVALQGVQRAYFVYMFVQNHLLFQLKLHTEYILII